MSTQIPAHPAIDAVMTTAASVLGMEIVFLGGLTEDTFTFERVRASGEWPGVEEGVSAPREASLCHHLLAGAPSRTSDAANDPAYAEVVKRSELGAAVADGTVVLPPRVSIARRLIEHWYGAELPEAAGAWG